MCHCVCACFLILCSKAQSRQITLYPRNAKKQSNACEVKWFVLLADGIILYLNIFYDDRSSLWVFIFLCFYDGIIFVCIAHKFTCDNRETEVKYFSRFNLNCGTKFQADKICVALLKDWVIDWYRFCCHVSSVNQWKNRLSRGQCVLHN